MRITIVHNESVYFAGAQRMLGYYLEDARNHCEITLALTDNPRMRSLIPAGVQVVRLNAQANSLAALPSHLVALATRTKNQDTQLFHGWTARDWELAALPSRLLGVPAVGTLHDHPQASFISKARQVLMRGSAALGLDRVVCVSGAVQEACFRCGYDHDRTQVIRNGLPLGCFTSSSRKTEPIRFGFIGAFSDRKGIAGLFAMMQQLSQISQEPWELLVAGGAQDQSGQALWNQLVEIHRDASWWNRLKILGWVDDSDAFFKSIDLLICPSKDFDPFPTVLLEAAKAGVPALATRVGGVQEIVMDSATGWVIEPEDWIAGGELLAKILVSPDLLRNYGFQARCRMEQKFSVQKMVADYMSLYSELIE